MKSQWIWLALLASCVNLSAWKCLAEVHFIPGEKRAELESVFSRATPYLKPQGAWVCDMYGIRSGLQIVHNVKLYSFSPLNGSFKNGGAQIVQVYKSESGEMRGSAPAHGEELRDDVRMTKDTHLISRLTQVSSGQVVAYSVCRPG